MSVKKEVFDVKIDDKETKVAVNRPNYKHQAEAQKAFNKYLKDMIFSDAIVRGSIEPILRQHGLWDDDKTKERSRLEKTLRENIKKLGTEEDWDKLSPPDIESRKEIAKSIESDRASLRSLNTEWNGLDSNTAETLAEGIRFDRLVSLCTVYDDSGKAIFKDFEDYLERRDEPVAVEAGKKMASLYYNLKENFEDELPERKFLKKFEPEKPAPVEE